MTLKKVSPQIEVAQLGPVRMWRDDLEKIEKLIRHAIGDIELEISVFVGEAEYRVDAVVDIREIESDRISRINMVSPQHGLRLTLGDGGNHIMVREADLTARGMINELLRMSRQRRLFRLYYFLMGTRLRNIVFSLTCMTIGVLSTIRLHEQGSPLPGAAAIWTSVGGVVAFIAWFILFKPDYSRLCTKGRQEAPSFWTRKRDDIGITITSNVISLIAGGLIGYWINTIT